MSSEYEIIWRFECSGDEAAREILRSMQILNEADKRLISEHGWKTPTIRLVKVMSG